LLVFPTRKRKRRFILLSTLEKGEGNCANLVDEKGGVEGVTGPRTRRRR